MKSRAHPLQRTSLLVFAGVVTLLYVSTVIIFPLTSGLQLGRGYDFKVYYDAAIRLRSGQPLYNDFVNGMPKSPMAYVYISPPVFSLIVLPYSFLPLRSAIDAWALTSYVLLIPVVVLLARLAGGADLLCNAAWITLWLIFSYLPLGTILHGQTNVFVLLSITAGIYYYERKRDFVAALWLAFGIIVKVVSAMPLLTLARMRPRPYLIALLAVVALNTLIFPTESVRFLTRAMPWVLTRERLALHNQAPQAFLQRLFRRDSAAAKDEYAPTFDAPLAGKVATMVYAIGMLALLIYALWRSPRSAEEVRLGYSLAILALVTLPRMTEFHHMLWCLVPVVILAAHAMQDERIVRRRRLIGCIVVSSMLISFPPFIPSIQHALHDLLQTPAGPFFASYSAFGLVGLFLMNWRILIDVQRSGTSEVIA